MIKKLMALMIVALATLASVCALTETHTIYLISVVNEIQPQFVIRNTETGEIGQSIVYSTDEISEHNVRTSFEILQANDSNYRGKVHFDITASELVAFSNGKEYRTDGVRIRINNSESEANACFDYQFTSHLCAGEVVSSFDVIWSTNQNLTNATYQAIVTLTYSAS